MSYEKLKKAQIDQEAIEFSERLAIENPGMYSADEMKSLLQRHSDATATTNQAMREDLASMPPEMQTRMKEMLKNSGVSDEVWVTPMVPPRHRQICERSLTVPRFGRKSSERTFRRYESQGVK